MRKTASACPMQITLTAWRLIIKVRAARDKLFVTEEVAQPEKRNIRDGYDAAPAVYFGRLYSG